MDMIWYIFQSTRPLWGATAAIGRCPIIGVISIHAPLVGRDRQQDLGAAGVRHFNPRAPCGARQQLICIIDQHAGYFNPRAPCGARQRYRREQERKEEFQSTRPLWGATRQKYCPKCADALFQSTRPLWGATANLTEFELQICAWVTKSNRDFRGSAAACSVVLSGCAPRFWQRRCEPAGGGMIAWGSHQMISAPSGA